jgi:hypothetical protein
MMALVLFLASLATNPYHAPHVIHHPPKGIQLVVGK